MVIKNFLFHRVSDEIDQLWPPMKPALFERIIKKISNQYQVVNLEDYLNNKNNYLKNRKPIATVLFDDGYKDNIEYAAPILKQYHCPASFYVVTDCIDRNVPTWTYIVDYIFQYTNKPTIELNADYVPEVFKKNVILKTPNEQIKRLKPWMKTLPNNLRLEVMNSILEQGADVSVPRTQMMKWSEVKQLSDNGFTIGSHTHTHPMLGKLESLDEIKWELETSFYKIKEKLGFFPESISYPIGSYDKRVTDLAKTMGYKWGLAVEQKFYKNQKDNLFAIPRVELYQQAWYKVNARITGLHPAIINLWI